MKRAERPLYPLRRTKDEDRDAPADDALVSLYDRVHGEFVNSRTSGAVRAAL